MARGNQGQAIFRDDHDRRRFLDVLGEASGKTGWRVHAYVLMGNHYHLLLETPEGNLVTGMKWLQGTYTQRFNSRHEVFGHLFQGRYKAVVIDGGGPGYFVVVGTYIHLNPVREWLCRERVLAGLGLKPGEIKRYEAYMESRVWELADPARHPEWEARWKGL